MRLLFLFEVTHLELKKLKTRGHFSLHSSHVKIRAMYSISIFSHKVFIDLALVGHGITLPQHLATTFSAPILSPHLLLPNCCPVSGLS